MSERKIDPEIIKAVIKETNQEMNDQNECHTLGYLQSEDTNHKFYIVDSKVVSKEKFIQLLLADLYFNTNMVNLRERIDRFLNINELFLRTFAEETETGEIVEKKASHTYETYENISVSGLEVDDFDIEEITTNTGDCDGDINFENPSVESHGYISEQTKHFVSLEVFPLKKYEVSYYIEVKPLLPYGSGGVRWKKVSEIVEATRFRDAKELVRQKLLKAPNKFKKMEIIEL